MPQNVVTCLMSEDEEGGRHGRFGNRIIGDYNTLGGAESRDIRVHASLLGTGVHDEQAVGRDFDSGTMRDLLNFRDQERLRRSKRLEGEKKRIDDQGLQEENNQ